MEPIVDEFEAALGVMRSMAKKDGIPRKLGGLQENEIRDRVRVAQGHYTLMEPEDDSDVEDETAHFDEPAILQWSIGHDGAN